VVIHEIIDLFHILGWLATLETRWIRGDLIEVLKFSKVLRTLILAPFLL